MKNEATYKTVQMKNEATYKNEQMDRLFSVVVVCTWHKHGIN